MSLASKPINRRSFIKLAGLAAAGTALPLVSPDIGLASLDKRLSVAQETRMLMGTLVSVTVLDASPALAQDAMNAAFARIAQLTPVFDRHGADGAVHQLNSQGGLKDAPGLLINTLKLCDKVSRFTHGAFDITVAPLIDLTRQSFSASGKPPSRSQIGDALAVKGSVQMQGHSVQLTGDGAAITLDGVAKGLIVDHGLAAIAAKGARHAMINAGGDLAVLGDRGSGQPWRVGVADPKAPSQAHTIVKMTSGALATSGNYQVYFDRERLYHHIVNPSTGRSPRGDLSASVRAPSAMLADAMSTACFVMKPRQAMALLASHKDLQGMILTRHGQLYQTRSFV